jgi:hypothetical protein
MHYGTDSERRWLRSRRVAHKDVLQFYLERNATEGLSAFRDAERALGVAHDQRQLEDYFRGIESERLEKVIAALEVYEGELPTEGIVPLSIVLLNVMPFIPDRPRGMLDFKEPRIVVARVVLRALRQLPSPEAVQAAVNDVLPELTHLSAQAELVRLVGHQEGAGHRLVSEEVAKAYEDALARRVEEAPAMELAAEGDLLRLLLAAERTTGRSPLLPERVTPELTVAVVMSAAGEVTSQSFGSRAVSRTPRLAWDVLTSFYGGEDELRRAIDETRDLATVPPDYPGVLSLADKYLSGWRPREFGSPFGEDD